MWWSRTSASRWGRRASGGESSGSGLPPKLHLPNRRIPLRRRSREPPFLFPPSPSSGSVLGRAVRDDPVPRPLLENRVGEDAADSRGRDRAASWIGVPRAAVGVRPGGALSCVSFPRRRRAGSLAAAGSGATFAAPRGSGRAGGIDPLRASGGRGAPSGHHVGLEPGRECRGENPGTSESPARGGRSRSGPQGGSSRVRARDCPARFHHPGGPDRSLRGNRFLRDGIRPVFRPQARGLARRHPAAGGKDPERLRAGGAPASPGR